NQLLSEFEVMLVIGSKLAPTETCNHDQRLSNAENQTIMQIDIELKHARGTFPKDMPIMCDAIIDLSDRVNILKEELLVNENRVNKRINELSRLKKEMNFMYCEEMESNSMPILPQRLIKELNEFVDEKTIITLDAGENRVFTIHYFESTFPGSIILPGSAGGMGYAIPSALAAKLTVPEKKVLAITGDGGFAMTMNGLMTAVQYNIPIV